MRFVLVSTHIDQTTGYSKVAYNMLKQLSTLVPKIKVFHFGFQRHPQSANIRKVPEGVNIYDAGANESPKEEGFGFNKIHEYLDMVNPDVVMIYNDPMVTYRFIESMKHDPKSSTYKLWIYLDQVYEGIAQPIMDKIREHADRIYCFTENWKTKLLEYGECKDVRIIEHAVDQSTFTILTPEAKQGIRAGLGIPNDATVLINLNRNSQRKRLDLTISAFIQVLKRNPENPIYLVIGTNISPQSGAFYDIPRIITRELSKAGLPLTYVQRIVLIDTSPPNIVGDDGINQLYNMADIGINTSDGEGYGLCQIEHLYTGAPQVITDVGSYRSFLDETVATFVKPISDEYFGGAMPLGGWYPKFSSEDVANAIEHTIKNLSDMKTAAKSYKFKTWSSVCDDFLEDLLNA
jgi:glycosyltransferase involved in cell wall biosynthesis